MSDLEISRRPAWVWAAGIIGTLAAGIIITFLCSGSSLPGQMVSAPAGDLEARYARHPLDNEVGFYFANALMRDGDKDRAYKVIADVAKRNPQSTRYLSQLANYAAANGRARETTEVYRRIAALDPADAHPHVELAHIFTEAGLLSDGLDEYDRALNLNPKVIYDPALYAECLIHAGRNEEAWRQLVYTLEHTPLQQTPYALLTSAGIKLGKFDDVEVWLTRRMNMEQEYPANLYQYSLARVAMARPKTAASRKAAEF